MSSHLNFEQLLGLGRWQGVGQSDHGNDCPDLALAHFSVDEPFELQLGKVHRIATIYGTLETSKATGVLGIHPLNVLPNARFGWKPHLEGFLHISPIRGHELVVNLLPSRIAEHPLGIQRERMTIIDLVDKNLL